MTTYEDNLLAARFAALAPEPLAGDWADVVERAGVAWRGRPRPRTSGMLRRRRRLAVVLAVVALVAVGAASAIGGVRDFILDRGERVGLIGMPPEGATPSTPRRGKLVISYRGHVPAKIAWSKTRKWGKSFAWVYADGRLIWLREDDRPYGANHSSTGYLEQRLTPAGIKLLRSKIITSGVFAHRPPAPREGNPRRIEVREGDRVLSAGTGFGAHRGDRYGKRLAALFEDPAAWLPPTAWADRDIKAYVPSKFAVCYGAFSKATKASRVLSALPAQVQEQLRARRPANPSKLGRLACSEVTTPVARALAAALAETGLERSAPAWHLGYFFEGPAKEPAWIFFEPYLPHGKWVGTLGD